MKPEPVTYQCNSPESPPVYMNDGEKSNDETPCDQFDWLFILKIITILIFIYALYLMGAFPGQKWIWEEEGGGGAPGLFSDFGGASFSDLGGATVAANQGSTVSGQPASFHGARPRRPRLGGLNN